MEEPVRFCEQKLAIEVSVICKWRYNEVRGNGHRFSKRGIVDECCFADCTRKFIKNNYCGPEPAEPITTKTVETTTKTPRPRIENQAPPKINILDIIMSLTKLGCDYFSQTMESLLKPFYILLITFSWVAAKNRDSLTKEEIEPIQSNANNEQVCPPLGLGIHFEVTTIQTRTRMYGCAYLKRETVISLTPVLNLWLERPTNNNFHGHCDNLMTARRTYNESLLSHYNNVGDMDHFVFECMPKYDPINSEENVQGWHYITLLQHWPYLRNNTETDQIPSYRCAVYDVHDASVEGVKVIRMAISAPLEGRMDESQCEGLAGTMGQDYLPYLPKGRRAWPNGSIYLYLLGRPLFDERQKINNETVKYLSIIL
ncbi:uncharacterized protein LOC112596662 [Melanaphis sacchari]|uniref:uncharacterized protein LOC112596662 n=1 Tax=Melanaphis sacchari TaxID=742174 RepID=UPI000DC14D77|nr:uncharacterized protein LOC112596662 [Melanaphis sacchari]